MTPAGPSRAAIEAVVFDFNGVLVWDIPLHEAAWKRYAAEQLGLAPAFAA